MAFADTERDRGASSTGVRGSAEPTARARVLVVDDDDAARGSLETLLRGEGFATCAAPDGEAALTEAGRSLPDVVLTDLQMPRLNGVELCRRLHEIDRELPVIVMTAFSDMQSVMGSLREGAEDYLIKPLAADAVLWCVERALARRAAKADQDRLRQKNDELYRTLNERLVLSSIREQEHADAEARQRAQLNVPLGNLKEGVCIADTTGRVLMINDAARAILGVGDGDMSTVGALHALEAQDLEGGFLD
jgi:DNA-binding response OmpR family regulator